LDSFTRECLQIDIGNILAHSAVTTVMVTHDISEALVMADRIVIMSPQHGSIVDTVRIATPRPRNEAFRHLESTNELRAHLWHVLRDIRLAADSSNQETSAPLRALTI
jgi:NitT/TauT family transport system ATP-binding protein